MGYQLAKDNVVEEKLLKDVYCESIIEMIDQGLPVMHLDADAMSGIGMISYRDDFPNNLIECGVSEANMMSVAAGMSQVGRIPFTHSLASFASRRLYDQLYISGAYARSNVKVVSTDSAITAGYNGGTHAPIEDIALMRAIPGMTVVEPTDSVMLRDLLQRAVDQFGMFYIRLTRKAPVKIYEDGSEFPIGGSTVIREGKDITIFTSGFLVAEILRLAEDLEAEGISSKVIDLYCLKPLDRKAIIEAAKETGAVVTVENHNVIAGIGDAVAAILIENYPVPMKKVGIQDAFLFSASPRWLMDNYGLSDEDVFSAVRSTYQKKKEDVQ
jgi:transketolase